jgi:hypothetical protein
MSIKARRWVASDVRVMVVIGGGNHQLGAASD